MREPSGTSDGMSIWLPKAITPEPIVVGQLRAETGVAAALLEGLPVGDHARGAVGRLRHVHRVAALVAVAEDRDDAAVVRAAFLADHDLREGPGFAGSARLPRTMPHWVRT